MQGETKKTMPKNYDLRLWKRQDIAAIVGEPKHVSLDVVAAMLGESRRKIMKRIARGEFYAGRVNDEVKISTMLFLAREGAGTDNPPMMVRAGVLVPRPTFGWAALLRLTGGRLSISRSDVATLTGQTIEEVAVDIAAHRLFAYRGFHGWSIDVDQLAADYSSYPR
jgi:hypothetical protein